jgi:hypothetical protein
MRMFWRLMSKSVIFSGIIALSIIITMCVLAVQQKPIPEIIVNIALVVCTFFFTSKSADISNAITEAKSEVK